MSRRHSAGALGNGPGKFRGLQAGEKAVRFSRMVSTLKLKNDLREVPRADGWLVRRCQARQIPDGTVHDLRLALDEVVSNVIRHGYGPGGSGEIQVIAEFAADRVRIEVRDAAKPFNPLSFPEPDLTIPIERRPRGGLGIFLVRKLMDRVDYFRENGCNRLVLERSTGR